MATKTIISTTTIGAMWIRKSLNVRPDRLAMMMFGGSPIRVAAPPMFEAKTSAIRNGHRIDPQSIAHQQGDGCDEQHGGDVVQQGRGHRRDQHQQHHHPSRRCLRALGGPDGGELEHAGPAQHRDDDHHAEEQEDDVPVDAGLPRVERVLGADHAEAEHQGRADQRDHGLVHPFGGDEDIRDHEHRDRDHRGHGLSPCHGRGGYSAASATCSSRDAVMTPISWSSRITAARGHRSLAMMAATSMIVSSASTTASSGVPSPDEVAHRLPAE